VTLERGFRRIVLGLSLSAGLATMGLATMALTLAALVSWKVWAISLGVALVPWGLFFVIRWVVLGFRGS